MKDDSLYILAIVAVVAVVGLVIMATGTSTVVEELPDMVQDDNSAIAGQAVSVTGGSLRRSKSASSVSVSDPLLPVDNDGDGYASHVDCDDTDDAVYPGATELCDGIDNDCNKYVDDGLSQSWYFADVDGDGYRAEDRQRLCGPSPSYPYRSNEAEQDCDDSDPYVGSASICYSAIDGNGTSVTIGPYCSIEQVDGMYQSVVEVPCP